MYKELVHNKAIEVFETIMSKISNLQASKRIPEDVFKKELRFLAKKVYSSSGLKYIIFITQKEESIYCLATWEVMAEFNSLNEELFYFIKSKMMIDTETEWFVIPFQVGPGIKCSYQKNEGTPDLSFLTKKDIKDIKDIKDNM